MPIHTNSILTKTAGIVVAVIVILISALGYSSHRLVETRFSQLEQQSLETLMQRVVNELHSSANTLSATVRDWAPWDETYEFVRDLNPDFIEKNMSAETFRTLRINFFLVYDAQGTLVYQQFFDLEKNQFLAANIEVPAIIARTPRLLLHQAKNLQQDRTGFLSTKKTQDLLVLAAAPILTSQFAGPARGTLVMGRYLSRAEIKRLNKALKVQMALIPYDNAQQALARTSCRSLQFSYPATCIHPVTSEQVTAFSVLSDVNDQPTFIVQLSQNRAVFRQGLAMWRQFTVFMCVFAAIVILVLLGLLNHFIMRKLTLVSRQVEEIAKQGEHGLRISPQGRDEIGQLSRQINAMLAALDHYHVQQKEHEQFLRHLLDSINCGVMTIDAQSYHITAVNKKGADIIGRDRAEIIGEICYHYICPLGQEHCHVWDESAEPAPAPQERQLRRSDGSLVPVLSSLSLVPYEGNTFLIESFIDISGLKETERELQLKEAKYRQFFEEDLTGDFISDNQGGILDCNAAFARMLGYDSVAAAKKSNMFVHYFSQEDRIELRQRLQREKTIERHQWILRHCNGNPIYCVGNLAGVFDQQGQLMHARGYIFDETRRVLLEKDLLRRQKMEAIGTLAGGIAHDFNNILSGIIGYAEIIQRDIDKESNTRLGPYLQNILVAGERARDLIRQILTFSRQSETELRPLVLKQAVEDVIHLMRASLPATIEIIARLSSEGAILADQVQVHQILMNLCTNAGYAMKEKGGLLTIGLEDVQITREMSRHHAEIEPGDYLRLWVEDTGKGIPEHIQERIFEPFFTTKVKGEGTGLGLAMVHGIVATMKGHISLHSAVGEGTRFDVYLPQLAEKQHTGSITVTALPKGNEHVVYVDDDPFLVEIGRELLRGLGYRVTEFTNSSEALVYLSQENPQVDLVITDMTMPQCTGLELAKALYNAQSGIPVILCSGNAELLTKEEQQQHGISDVLHKPVTMNSLARKTRDILDKYRT